MVTRQAAAGLTGDAASGKTGEEAINADDLLLHHATSAQWRIDTNRALFSISTI